MSPRAISREVTIAEWRAVIGLMDAKLANARTNSHILPVEIEAWKLIRAKSLSEITALLRRQEAA
jgi:hypothetical protein